MINNLLLTRSNYSYEAIIMLKEPRRELRSSDLEEELLSDSVTLSTEPA